MRRLLVLAAALAVVIVGVSVPEKSASAAEGTCSVEVTELRTKGNQRGGGQLDWEDHRVRIDISFTGWGPSIEDWFLLKFDTPDHKASYPHHVKWWGDLTWVYHRVGGDGGHDGEMIQIGKTEESQASGSVSIEVGYVHTRSNEDYPFFLDNFMLVDGINRKDCILLSYNI